MQWSRSGMEVSEYDPQIVWFDDALEKDFCKKVIKKFNKDERVVDGVTGMGYNPDIKQSLDLQISHLEDWKTEDDVFYKSLNTRIQEYKNTRIQEYKYTRIQENKNTRIQVYKYREGKHNTYKGNIRHSQ